MRKPSKKKLLKEIKEYLQPVCCGLCIRDVLNKLRRYHHDWEKYTKEVKCLK